MDGESECPPLSCWCGMIVDSGGKAISASARALLGRFVARREAMLWVDDMKLGLRHDLWMGTHPWRGNKSKPTYSRPACESHHTLRTGNHQTSALACSDLSQHARPCSTGQPPSNFISTPTSAKMFNQHVNEQVKALTCRGEETQPRSHD